MNTWPALDYSSASETYKTLHQWLQIVGKVRLKSAAWQNQSWHVTLYVTPFGLTTGTMPVGENTFQIDFDFREHRLIIKTCYAEDRSFNLTDKTVSSFYKELFSTLKSLGIEVDIHAAPNEMEPAIPFADNHMGDYDKSAVESLWKALYKVDSVFKEFNGRYKGKKSPVHLFWGAFDLAVTRFTGRPAPKHPGGMPNMPLEVMQEAYSQEVFSVGFWPGADDFPVPVFYAYCYPTPESFKEQNVLPKEAFWSNELGEFMLKYEDVISSTDPKSTLLDFMQSTYDAAATLGDYSPDLLVSEDEKW
ncbi:MAG: DUF5996 family protein [Candidatus Kapaibacteriales bacterium]